MSTDSIRKIFLSFKDLLQVGFCGLMILTGSWLDLFILSPFFVPTLLLFNFISVGLSINQIKKYYESSNDNLDRYVTLLLNGLNIALLGLVVAAMVVFGCAVFFNPAYVIMMMMIGFILINGPLLMIISTGLTVLSQAFFLGLNLVRWFESPKNSPQSSHFLQTAFAAFFDVLTAAVVLSTVMVFLLTPAAVVALPILACCSVSLIAVNASWRLLSNDIKSHIKSFVGIEQPSVEKNVCTIQQQTTLDSKSELMIPDRGYRLFTTPDHLSRIKGIEAKEWQKEYLLKIISQKLASYTSSPEFEKNSSKKNLLEQISRQLNGGNELIPINKKYTQIDSPQVFTSFWCEKGEIESITDAFNWYCEGIKPVQSCMP